jgi:hypothetical protein
MRTAVPYVEMMGHATNMVPATGEALVEQYPLIKKDNVSELFWHHPLSYLASAIREARGVPEHNMGSRVFSILRFPKLRPIAKSCGQKKNQFVV